MYGEKAYVKGKYHGAVKILGMLPSKVALKLGQNKYHAVGLTQHVTLAGPPSRETRRPRADSGPGQSGTGLSGAVPGWRQSTRRMSRCARWMLPAKLQRCASKRACAGGLPARR